MLKSGTELTDDEHLVVNMIREWRRMRRRGTIEIGFDGSGELHNIRERPGPVYIRVCAKVLDKQRIK